MEKIEMTDELQNKLLDAFENRAQFQGLKPKSKKRLDAQCDFLVGAISAIDSINNAEQSCVPVRWYLAMIRGEYITKKS